MPTGELRIMLLRKFLIQSGCLLVHFAHVFRPALPFTALVVDHSYADVAKAYGVEAICVQSAAEFKPAMEKAMEANRAGRPFLVEAPMENIAVPTPGCWNINDIYRPNEFVSEGKLVRKEEGRWLPPSHGNSHKPK